MSERTNGTTIAPENTTGLAMTLGELKANLQHFIDDSRESAAELNNRLDEETSSRDTAITELKGLIADLVGVVEETVQAMESLATARRPDKDGKTPAGTALPTRARGEKNRELFTRLAAWARAQEYPEPPKPGGTEFNAAYDKRITAWMEKATSS